MNTPKNKLTYGQLYKFTRHDLYEFDLYIESPRDGWIQHDAVFPQDAIVLYLGGEPVHYYKESYSKFLYKSKIVYVSFTDQKYLTNVSCLVNITNKK